MIYFTHSFPFPARGSAANGLSEVLFKTRTVQGGSDISALRATGRTKPSLRNGTYKLLLPLVILFIVKDVFSQRKKLQKKWKRGRLVFCTFWCWMQPCSMWLLWKRSSPILFLVSLNFSSVSHTHTPANCMIRSDTDRKKSLVWRKWVCAVFVFEPSV